MKMKMKMDDFGGAPFKAVQDNRGAGAEELELQYFLHQSWIGLLQAGA